MKRQVLYLSGVSGIPPALDRFLQDRPDTELVPVGSVAEVRQSLDRGMIEMLVIDGGSVLEEGIDLCRELKSDTFDSVLPIVFDSEEHRIEEIEAAFETGADEFLTGTHTIREKRLRLGMVLDRAARDVAVHPTTMLPGTKIIQLEISRRIDSGKQFAVCYADIDSFKEFNDKYSYHRGDTVIRIVSMILRDIVRRMSDGGFVGHVGGDDFIYTVPFEDLKPVSHAILKAFDTLMPLQYEVADRERGYIMGEDRQGNLHQVPLMSLSIGVVTNVRRRFTHPARVSELASEMKTYAKTFEGSIFVVDRRRDRPRRGEVERSATAGVITEDVS